MKKSIGFMLVANVFVPTLTYPLTYPLLMADLCYLIFLAWKWLLWFWCIIQFI